MIIKIDYDRYCGILNTDVMGIKDDTMAEVISAS